MTGRVQLRRGCRLCAGEGLLRTRLDPSTYSDFERGLIEAAGLDVYDMPARLCCQLCDSGEVAPPDQHG